MAESKARLAQEARRSRKEEDQTRPSGPIREISARRLTITVFHLVHRFNISHENMSDLVLFLYLRCDLAISSLVRAPCPYADSGRIHYLLNDLQHVSLSIPTMRS
jgi:hypothetical protein